MSSQITVGISDMNIARGDNNLVTFALGSCVGICLFDATRKMGALGHIMLPTSPDPKNEVTVNKYADTCIPNMLQRLQRLGCNPALLVAKIAGGAKMFEVSGDSSFGNIGERNVQAVRAILRSHNIRILADDTGLNYGRTVYFNTLSGIMTVKSFNHGVKEY